VPKHVVAISFFNEKRVVFDGYLFIFMYTKRQWNESHEITATTTTAATTATTTTTNFSNVSVGYI
jgi:hypothetical protein